jgi:hypothetical protein
MNNMIDDEVEKFHSKPFYTQKNREVGEASLRKFLFFEHARNCCNPKVVVFILITKDQGHEIEDIGIGFGLFRTETRKDGFIF